ncbi:PXMP2/4 family protein 4 [Gracilariopsis chorda]|uniref:PXMP2/4 family protein 4 n=1 Tax=Gracilariopsis chorda TaxID=448386 RepID=A0A2V3IYH5_9FLOR|nr:PXMP2/4 family protein 4 [Gracilariopsis chorda]|eukprot:PXF47171.1 PXMP2/4 family protein 4 [Gracilariopsis chorda]
MTVPVSIMHAAQKGRLPRPAIHPSKRRRCHFPRRSLGVLLLILGAIVVLYDIAPTFIDSTHISAFSPHHVRRFSRRTLRLYQRQLHLHPLSSRAVTAAIIFFIADVFAQFLSSPRSASLCFAFQFDRLFRYTLYGLVVMGPFLYVWYEAMHQYGPDDDLRGSLVKCLFEQITLEPCCIIMYIGYDAIICRRGLATARQTLAAKFLPLWFKNAVFWLPANFANYYIGTPDLRVIFANLCSLFWNIYFSGNVNRSPSQQSSNNLSHQRKSPPSTPRHLSSNSV